MKLSIHGLSDRAAWEKAGIALPKYDVEKVRRETRDAPVWVHFGAGNIFRGFVASLQQHLLNEGRAQKGIIALETFDFEIIEKIYKPFDDLTLNVTLHPDATTSCEVLASVCEGIALDGAPAHRARVTEIFARPGLQMASFTITEKGYAIHGADGALLPVVAADIRNGPGSARHAMSVAAEMMWARYRAGGAPIALVSMDNCSHNGERLRQSVLTIARAWLEAGHVEEGFLQYLEDEAKVGFPWSMIDKITPRPDRAVEEMLRAKGVEDMGALVTSKNTYIAPFVNAEAPQYLVIEDHFPAGRPALEKAGVYLTNRDTVNRTERMKVTTCLNPLHTAMSVYGCLLGYTLIHREMADPEIVALVRRLGYVEGLPVVTDPGILSPRAFLDEVVQERLPNPFMPDAPQRIATDTSQKVGIRFGETIKSYLESKRDLKELVAIPLALAGWFRYLLGVDDQGQPMEVSADPLRDDLQARLKGIEWNRPDSYQGQLRGILQNAAVFGQDLTKTQLADAIEGYFVELLQGQGAVRQTLRKYLL